MSLPPELNTIEELTHSTHSCLIYETPEEQIAFTTQFLKIGLERNELCVLLDSPGHLDLIRKALKNLHIDIESLEKQGKMIFSSMRDYLTDGRFEPTSVLKFLQDTLEKALADGFTALRATGDINWELGPDQDFHVLLDYEAQLDKFATDAKLVGVCQYRKSSVSPEAITNALKTHQTVVLGDLFCGRNLFYEPASIRLLKEPSVTASRRADWMCRQLARTTSDQSRRDTQHRQTDDRYRMMIEEIKDYAIFMLDPTGHVTSWNVGAERIKGYRDAEVIGKHLSLFYTPEDAQNKKPQRLLAEALANGRIEDEGWRVRKDRSRFWANVVITPVHDAEGVLRGFTKITRDMTEKRHAQELLQLKNEELLQTRKIEAVGILAGGIAHDFNNLLTGMLGCVELLTTSGPLEKEQMEELNEIQKAGHRAMALTKQLLAFSRRQTIQPEPVNLNTVITELSTILRKLVREDIAFSLTLDPALEIINADRSQLEQILLNLVVNARDAMPQGGSLFLETTNADVDSDLADQLQIPAGSYVRLSVADTGVGIEESLRGKIFEPFFTTKKEGVGTGLGLATVHGIVNQNHGAISVYSEVGRGATFRVWFPRLREGAASRSAKKSVTPGIIPRGTETILLVEDESIVSTYVTKILRNLGYQVLSASSAKEALEIVAVGPPRIDLLLTDVILPEKNGRELAEAVLQKLPATKLLYMSGYPAEVIGNHGVLEHHISFLEKPFNASQLGTRVRDLLDSK